MDVEFTLLMSCIKYSALPNQADILELGINLSEASGVRPVANINISGLADQEKEEYTKKAKESGATSRSEWLRWRLRAGVRLWDADGKFNRERLDATLEEETKRIVNPTSGGQSDLKDVIESNLSTTEPTSFDGLCEIVVEELVTTALYELQKEDRVDHIPGKGYRKSWKDD